jgi:hypothetical protein
MSVAVSPKIAENSCFYAGKTKKLAMKYTGKQKSTARSHAFLLQKQDPEIKLIAANIPTPSQTRPCRKHLWA